MSSQGPSSGSRSTPTGETGCYGPTGPSQVPRQYTFTNASIRDGSDWISYKKQTLILNENKSKVFQDPWFAHGNDYRLQFLQGRYKNGTPVQCNGCTGGAFSGNGPF
jgi:hypothetical protein